MITFRVGPETFVLDIMAVRQIIPYTGSTSVPTAPAFIEGIIVLRNEVIPIIDLRDRLYPQLTERVEQPLVLITHTQRGRHRTESRRSAPHRQRLVATRSSRRRRSCAASAASC